MAKGPRRSHFKFPREMALKAWNRSGAGTHRDIKHESNKYACRTAIEVEEDLLDGYQIGK